MTGRILGDDWPPMYETLRVALEGAKAGIWDELGHGGREDMLACFASASQLMIAQAEGREPTERQLSALVTEVAQWSTLAEAMVEGVTRGFYAAVREYAGLVADLVAEAAGLLVKAFAEALITAVVDRVGG